MPKELPSDMLNDSMKECVFKKKNIDAFKELTKKTHFTAREIEALSLIHWKITKEIGSMHRLGFRDILHAGLDFTENYLIDRIFSAFDKRNDLAVTMDSWNIGFSEVLRGTLDEKIKFGYRVYDLMRTNKIRRESIFPMMRGCLIKQQPDEDPEEAVKDLIDLLLKKVDTDRDGKVSEEDYSSTVKEKNLLFLQCMGPVFPSRESRYAFLTTFTTETGRF
ncbi:calaxin-like [Athalia rosae]|uniref:calaxin-like n=1 Tax=Athalia rosae TaxID=37344 RepID=UPI0006261A40|nr:calaxin-like [Athalia rosae]